ncbi:Glucosamine--fructose-6-phosphate aminotransferase [isomerizing] [Kluyvera cryocrescens]|uniref:Glutamine--fructose-6-phosphate aminotransferase [isomerizing] n=1 Tax=Kluyvera cryocrescens TaxID=580 RepID=A0A485B4J8_KLUCR|nr:Glucosamine--fructose-6-phosphate aminotransferase [isomerizing] [Kluyvera cryocrescens]
MLAQAVEEHPLSGGTGIAHTRWATHGEPSESNAHPHVSDHIVVVHNGIIENHEPLREMLQARGYVFVSATDTEVIAHLVHWELEQGGTLREAVLARDSSTTRCIRYSHHGLSRSRHAAGCPFR